MKSFHLGTISGLQIDILPVTIPGTLLLWAGFSAIAHYGIGITPAESFLLGLIVTLLHWTSVLLHHLGHYLASLTTGYPMSGIQVGMFGILARDFYPTTEPELSPAIHIRRALGGPIVSGLLSILLFLLLPVWSGNWYWPGLIILLENVFVFTLQVFVPLGFNDGGTILKNLQRKLT